MESGVFDLLVNFGPGGTLAAICFYKWQKAEDRLEKLRDAFETKTQANHETSMRAQREGFDNTLRVEGVLNNAVQVISANTTAIQALISRGDK